MSLRLALGLLTLALGSAGPAGCAEIDLASYVVKQYQSAILPVETERQNGSAPAEDAPYAITE